jgi:hypothetical protein
MQQPCANDGPIFRNPDPQERHHQQLIQPVIYSHPRSKYRYLILAHHFQLKIYLGNWQGRRNHIQQLIADERFLAKQVDLRSRLQLVLRQMHFY